MLVGAVEGSLRAWEAFERSAQCTVAAVVTLPSSAAGRHSDFADLTSPARAAGAKVIETTNVNDPEVLLELTEVAPDYIFEIGWSQLCRNEFLAITPGRVVGYHPAPLPRLLGRAPIPWTILNSEPITAGTLFWMDEGTDSGDILDQQFFHVRPYETAHTLYENHMQALSRMLERTLTSLGEGRERRDPQDDRCATWGARRRPEDGRVNWQQPASDVLRLIRAAGKPYPGAFTNDSNGEIRLWSAEPCRAGRHHVALPGQLIERSADGFSVMCGDGEAVRITNWSIEEGRLPTLHSMFGN